MTGIFTPGASLLCYSLLVNFVCGGVVSAQAAGSREQVRASHILVGSKEEADALRKTIMDQGGDKKAFSAIARKESKDVTTKLLGGDVGWFGAGNQMEKAFTETSFGLKVGEISQPVQTPYGWHLILLTDRKDASGEKPVIDTQPPQPPEIHTPPTTPGAQNTLTPPGVTVPPANVPPVAVPPGNVPPVTPAPAVAPAAPPKPVDGKRRTLGEQGFRITLETVKSSNLSVQQFTYAPEQAVELNLSVKNESSKEQKFIARELLPLGLKVTALGEATPIEGDFTSLAEPAAYFATLKTYEIAGVEVSLNDYWKTLVPKRYKVYWDIATFTANLDKRFPKAKESPDFAMLADLQKKRQAITVDSIVRDTSPRLTLQRGRDVAVSYFDPIKPDKKYFCQIKLSPTDPPLVIALDTQKAYQAARHFASLVMEGFYDGLDFFEVEEGDYLLGGCPTRTGTGAPAMNLPLLRNDAKLEHKRGTVAFVSRNVRSQAPVRGGQVGSIFVVCLKPHPEWNDEHVPFGEVTSGLEILEKPGRRQFSEVTILTEDQLQAQGPLATATTPNAAVGNPEAAIKTSKGVLTVELFEDLARNTATNFVALADTQKFFDKAEGGGKQKFFSLMKDAASKPLLIQTGSPTNTPDGTPGYSIRSEPNAKKCVKGALVMAVAYDGTNYVPDSAGSQFFICLQDIPYYDYQKVFTVFGQVTGGLDVLDKLAEGDTIESVEITKKKPHAYVPQKITSP